MAANQMRHCDFAHFFCIDHRVEAVLTRNSYGLRVRFGCVECCATIAQEMEQFHVLVAAR